MACVITWASADVAAEISERRRVLELLGGVELGRWHVSLSLRERVATPAPGWPTEGSAAAVTASRGVGIAAKQQPQRLVVLRMSDIPAATYFCLATQPLSVGAVGVEGPAAGSPTTAVATAATPSGSSTASAAAAKLTATVTPIRRWELLEAGAPAEAILDKFGLFERKRDRRVEGTRYKVGDFVVGLGGVSTRGGTRHVALQLEYLPCRAHATACSALLAAFLEGLGVAPTLLRAPMTLAQLDGSYAAQFGGLAGVGIAHTQAHAAALFVHAFQDVR